MNRAPRSLLALAVLATIAVPVTAGARASTRCSSPADFNGDGYHDMVVGVPTEDIGSREDAGAVNIIYGGLNGLHSSGNQSISQDSPGIIGAAEPGDEFGTAMAAGDFDGDGYSDLAVGTPFEDTTVAKTGAVSVIYGSRSGLTSRDQAFTLDTPGIKGRATPATHFGASLAAADFDGDGRDDLAIGVPNFDVVVSSSSFRDSGGAVVVLYGSSSGVTTRDQLWTQDSPGIEGTAEHGDRFGTSLVSGDFNADGRCDLVVGVPDEAIGSREGAGAINIIYGSSTGLTATGDRALSQDSAGVPGGSEAQDAFGTALAAGDFNGDGKHDLAVGVPGEDLHEEADGAGVVHVFLGSGSGITTTGTQIWHQDRGGIQETAEDSDAFGRSLAIGDFDRDGMMDLAVSAPHESRPVEPSPPADPTEDPIGTLGELLSAGVDDSMQAYGIVHILHGARGGLSDRDQVWSEDSPGIADQAEEGDLFGFTLAAGRFDPGSAWDLAIGVPNEGIGEVSRAGAMHALYGSGDGLSSSRSQFWSQDSSGIKGAAEDNDRMALTILS